MVDYKFDTDFIFGWLKKGAQGMRAFYLITVKFVGGNHRNQKYIECS
jgi:hypothetical protein